MREGGYQWRVCAPEYLICPPGLTLRDFSLVFLPPRVSTRPELAGYFTCSCSHLALIQVDGSSRRQPIFTLNITDLRECSPSPLHPLLSSQCFSETTMSCLRLGWRWLFGERPQTFGIRGHYNIFAVDAELLGVHDKPCSKIVDL